MAATCELISLTVQCQSGSVRLSYSRIPLEGTLEICSNETWHSVCDRCWDNNDAAVVCHQLGYSQLGTDFVNCHLKSKSSCEIVLRIISLLTRDGFS